MADTKISALTASTTPLAGTEVLPIVQSGTTKKVSVANLTAGRAVSVGSLASSGSVSIGTGGPYAVGSVYSDASWGMLFTAAQASPANAEYAWLNSAGTELARIDTNGNTTIKLGSLVIGTAGKGITGSSAFSVTLANGASGTLVDLATALPAGGSGFVIVAGASAGKATILVQRDQGGYYSATELGTQPRGTYITSITISGTNLQITNSTGGSETFSGKVTVMTA
jgi:hypothetical protein